MGNSGDFIITWRGYAPGVYAQRYDSSGTPLGGNFAANDDSLGPYYVRYTDVAMDDSGNFTIVWQDEWKDGEHTDDDDIYAQTFSSSGERIGGNYFVPNPLYETRPQSHPGVAAHGRNVYFAWQDDRRTKGWDIYAKVIDRPSVGAQEEITIVEPLLLDFQQSYPNPFLGETNIRYQIPRTVYVRLEIYNCAGQVVNTLVDREQRPGDYRIKWNGTDEAGRKMASGVYFYRIEVHESLGTATGPVHAGPETPTQTATKKMVLVR
jgi:hypothetical protein